MTSNINKCVCVHEMLTNNINAEFEQHKNFVNEMETQYEKKHSRAAKLRISTIQKTRLVTK
jgi:hypothetical protein